MGVDAEGYLAAISVPQNSNNRARFGTRHRDEVHQAQVTIFANPTGSSSKGSWYAPALRSFPTDLGLLLAGAGVIVLALLVFRIVRNRRSSHPSEADEGQKGPGPPKSVYPEKKSGK